MALSACPSASARDLPCHDPADRDRQHEAQGRGDQDRLRGDIAHGQGRHDEHPHQSEKAKVERLFYSNTATGNVLSAASLEDTQVLLQHPAINPTKSESWAVDVTWMFPHFQIDVSPGGFWTHHFWPVSQNETLWESRFHVPDATDIWSRLQQEHYIARLAEILLEDVGNTERTQEGIDSGAMETMPLQDGEVMIRHSLHNVRKWVEAATVREALAK